MTEKGYLASLEQQTKWLEACHSIITYRNESGKELKTAVKEQDLAWFLNEHYPNKNYMIMTVEKINSAEIPALAKQITDEFALRQYGYVYNN